MNMQNPMPFVRLEKQGKNKTILHFRATFNEKSLAILFSYEDLVAVIRTDHEGRKHALSTDAKTSVTTQRHINDWIKDVPAANCAKVEQAVLEQAFRDSIGVIPMQHNVELGVVEEPKKDTRSVITAGDAAVA